MKKAILILLSAFNMTAYAFDIIPIGQENNSLYYKIGGANEYSLPPVSDTTTIRLDSSADLGLGNSCSQFNPALSIINSINNLKDTVDDLEQSIVTNATASLIQLPMYFLAQANPTAYNFFNNLLLAAHNQLRISTKSCEMVRDQIAKGQNPYQDWGMIAVNDQWKKHLSFVAMGNEDINQTKKTIDNHRGEDGLPWVQGANDGDNGVHAGGKSQPPIKAIADTAKAGYNTMLNRDLQSNDAAPEGELKHYFPNPKSASDWVTSVLGDHVITTCTDTTCKKQQGTVVGRGLLPWVTSCQNNNDNCVESIRTQLSNLITGNEAITKENLIKVSADGITISLEVISSIRHMDALQQRIIINKLAQEIAVQRVMDKAFIARNILSMGAQVPVIAANHPAQVIIHQAINNLDNDIRSLSFESEMKKKTISNTLTETLQFAHRQENAAAKQSPVSSSSQMMESGSLSQE